MDHLPSVTQCRLYVNSRAIPSDVMEVSIEAAEPTVHHAMKSLQ